MALLDDSADPVMLTKAAKQLLLKIRHGGRYARAGIVVTELRAVGTQSMFAEFVLPHAAKHIGPLIKQIRSAHETVATGLGRAGLREGRAWQTRRNMISSRYTTHWEELLTVKPACVVHQCPKCPTARVSFLNAHYLWDTISAAEYSPKHP